MMFMTLAVSASLLFGDSGQEVAQQAREQLALVEQAYQHRQGSDAAAWRDRIKSNEAALELSLDWLIRQEDGQRALQFADDMVPFWTAFGESPHARQRLEVVLGLPSAAAPSALRAKALHDAGLIAFREGDQRAATRLFEDSLAIARRITNEPAIATALIDLSRVALRNHDYTTVRRDAQEALTIRQKLGDLAGELSAIHMLAAMARMTDDTVTATKLYELTLGIAGQNDDQSDVAGELMNLGFVHLHRHDPEWAFRLLKQSEAGYRKLHDQRGLAWVVNGFAAVAAERKDATLAARLYGAVDTAMHTLGLVLDPDDQLDYDHYTEMVRTQLGSSEFDTLRNDGRQLSVDDAIKVALRERSKNE